MWLKRTGEIVRRPIGVRQRGLKRVQRRKSLQFDETWLDTPVMVPHQTEIDLHEDRHVSLIRPAKPIRHNALGGRRRLTTKRLPRELGAHTRELVEEGARKKTWRFRNGELDARPDALVQAPFEPRVFRRRPRRVECATKRWNHAPI